MSPTPTITVDTTATAPPPAVKEESGYESDASESSVDGSTSSEDTFSQVSTNHIPDIVKEGYRKMWSDYREHYIDPMQAIRRDTTLRERALNVLRTRSWPKSSQEQLTSLKTVESKLLMMILAHKEMCDTWTEEEPPASGDPNFYHDTCPFRQKLLRSLAKTERRIARLEKEYTSIAGNSTR